ncbi:dihydroorotate dehydrogenase [Virgibacillus necropolis]|uniref:Dihydroorotate dehydrogenase n=1 Tax=Virgibacillus necropolis TaxID=163877 RepID=A0A221MF15_9BACI|nr:dihydroorotate dehydrogenase [Virgibacillus necropolis]ASN06202.1 dihydroorotate dehydrogenase B catalytic subunit [Virgibacillus necropolis]
MKTQLKTEVNIGSLSLKNPIMPASGAFGLEMEKAIDFNQLGALVPKSITKLSQPGNVKPRVCETIAGMINSIGIQSKGLDHYLEVSVPAFARYNVPLIASVSAESVEEFVEMSSILGNHPNIDALELNISCPNLKGDGKAFGMDPYITEDLISKSKRVANVPVIAKLTPNVTSIQEIAIAAERGGADGLTVANTLLAMAIDVETRKPLIGNVMGGLSGPAIKPIIVRMIYQVAKVCSIPIIGCGGVMSGKDALEMIIAGAKAVQIGTASFINPTAITDIITEIHTYMDAHQINNINDLVGSVEI